MKIKSILTIILYLSVFYSFASDNSLKHLYKLTPERVINGYKNKDNWLAINITGKKTANIYLSDFELITIPLIKNNVINDARWSLLLKTLAGKSKTTLLIYCKNEEQNLLFEKYITDKQKDFTSYEIILIKGGLEYFSVQYAKLKEKYPDLIKKAEDYNCEC